MATPWSHLLGKLREFLAWGREPSCRFLLFCPGVRVWILGSPPRECQQQRLPFADVQLMWNGRVLTVAVSIRT